MKIKHMKLFHLKKNYSKYLICVFAIFFLILFSSQKVEAITQTQVESKLNELKSQYVGTVWNDNYYGIQCKGFANLMFYKLFGVVHIGAYDNNSKYYIPYPQGAKELGRLSPSAMTQAAAKNLLSLGAPGDFIQVKRRDKTYGHSMIMVSKDSNGINVFDCNSDGRNGVKSYHITWSSFYNSNSAMSLYRANNYSDISSGTIKPNIQSAIDFPTDYSDITGSCDETVLLQGWVWADDVQRITYSINGGIEQDFDIYIRSDNNLPAFRKEIPKGDFITNNNGVSTIRFRAYCGEGIHEIGTRTLTYNFISAIDFPAAENILTGRLDDTFLIQGWIVAPSINKVTYRLNDGPEYDLPISIRTDNNLPGYREEVSLSEAVPGYEENTFNLKLRVYCNNGAYDFEERNIIYTKKESNPPVISDIKVTDLSCTGYTVQCKISDDSGIHRVQFPTWTTSNGQDDIQYDWIHANESSGHINDDQVIYHVSITDHDNEAGEYKTHIYAYDMYGNCSVETLIVTIPRNQEELHEAKFWIDGPEDGAVITTDQILLEGWVVQISGIVKKTYSINGGQEKEMTNRERKDVAKQYLGYPSGNEGFTHYVSSEEFRTGDNQIQFFAYYGDGSKECLGTRSVKIDNAKISHNYGDWEIIKKSSCTQSGMGQRTCSICGSIEYQTIDAQGHRWEMNYTVDKAATCVNAGVESIHCGECGISDASTQRIIPQINHNYSEWNVIKEATCIEDGEKARSCSDCGIEQKETIKKGNHNYNAEIISPTCEEMGYTLHKCVNCNSSYKDSYRNAVGHIRGSWIITKQATKESAGEKIQKCLTCGKILNKKLIPMEDSDITEKQVKLNKTEVTLSIKNNFQLKVTEKQNNDEVVEYYSTDKKIASVSKTGKVSAKKAGTCDIVVTMKSGQTAKCKIIVPVTKTQKVKFMKKTLKLRKGKTVSIKIKRTPSYASDKLIWKSSKPKVVRVYKNGKVKGLKKGKSVVMVKTKSGFISKIKVVVQ